MSAVVRLPRQPRRDPGDYPSEQALLREAQAGDFDAFSAVFRRYQPAIFRICHRLLKDRNLAEDAAQEAFLRAFTRLSLFDLSRPVLPWLAIIARHACSDLARKLEKAELVDDVPDPQAAALIRTGDDVTWSDVAARDERARMEATLKCLPARARRAFLLYALEDWSYADIAAAEGVSLLAVKSLMFRARSQLRDVYASMRSLLIAPVGWLPLRWRTAARGERVQRLMSAPGTSQSMSMLLPQLVAACIALSLVIVNPLSMGTNAEASPRIQEDTIAGNIDQDHAIRLAERQNTEPDPAGSTDPSALDHTVDRMLDPNKNVHQPEDTTIRDAVISPRFASDRTMFLVGATGCAIVCRSVLFRSTDGGKTWTRLPARDLLGEQLLLPPRFGNGDHRIFAIGPNSGLQVSTDGGRSFEFAAVGAGAFRGSAAISPGFGDEHDVILIGAEALTIYDARTQAFSPAPYSSIPGPLEPAFSPNFADDGVIVVGASEYDPVSGVRGIVYRCETNLCETTRLDARMPRIQLSPAFARDQRAFAYDNVNLFASSDGARSFTRLPSPWGEAILMDVATQPDQLLTLVRSASGVRGRPGLYQSFDGGTTWHRISSPLLSQGGNALAVHGARAIAATPSGLACSIDSGFTWARRCPVG